MSSNLAVIFPGTTNFITVPVERLKKIPQANGLQLIISTQPNYFSYLHHSQLMTSEDVVFDSFTPVVTESTVLKADVQFTYQRDDGGQIIAYETRFYMHGIGQTFEEARHALFRAMTLLRGASEQDRAHFSARSDERHAYLCSILDLINEPPFTSLSADEKNEMRQELAVTLHKALVTKDWTEYDDALYAWRSTAEIMSDPELLADLLSPVNPAELVTLRRP